MGLDWLTKMRTPNPNGRHRGGRRHQTADPEKKRKRKQAQQSKRRNRR